VPRMDGVVMIDDAIARIDALHAEDPEIIDGRPAELVYAERMSAALSALVPSASDALRIAVRAQHLCRWRTPRASYPEGKAGYLRWRAAQAKEHASLAAEVLREVGYDEPTVERVTALVTKKDLARDDEAQALEDAACLVFLQHHFDAFAAERDEAQLIDILQKTWRKMSDRGRRAALVLPLSDRARELVSRALAG
jgi:hypothetical protein